jgi:hypothetical protein
MARSFVNRRGLCQLRSNRVTPPTSGASNADGPRGERQAWTSHNQGRKSHGDGGDSSVNEAVSADLPRLA